uniref:EF-hand domain-containing protein n=1 Tax=Kalanchoe fedtschenkoi TaxID=63787 RepID=A0A7N0U9N5_KALFE
MEEIRAEALEYYNNSSTQVKDLAIKFFNHMDSDGDSTISVAEFAAFIKGNGFLSRRLPNDQDLFASMDRNGNGNLDFNEFITFFFVAFASCNCDGCGIKLKGQRHLTCTTCFPGGGHTFDLCSTCFSSRNFAHQHTEFVSFETLMFESVAPVHQDSSDEDDKSQSSEEPEAYEALNAVTAEVVNQAASSVCGIM